MLLVLDSTVGAWMGMQMGVWGWGLALVDRQTSSLNLHKPCVCSGDGVLHLFGQKPQCKTQVWWACMGSSTASSCSVCVLGEAGVLICLLGSEKHICTWSEKRFVCETVRLQTSVIAMLLERTGISEERIFVQVYFGNCWSNTRTKPHPVTVSISGVTEVQWGLFSCLWSDFMGSWAFNRRAFRKVWDMEYSRKRSGQGSPSDYDFCRVFLRPCPSSHAEQFIWSERAVCSLKDQEMSKMPAHFVKQKKLAIT